jgi:HEAT repeat protein
MSLYYAWISIISGISALIGGQILDIATDLSGQFLGFTIDSYSLLFASGLVLPLGSVLLFRGVRADAAFSTGQFVSMFFRGNPFLAIESLISFHLAKDERSMVSTTERLGQAKSPLTVEELLEALYDPRFYVRFEALVSIARRGPDDRLMEALEEVLQGSDPALSVIAAWALGRIEDPRALNPLRTGLYSPFQSVRGHCARSLGSLGDQQSVPHLLDLLAEETDFGLRVAYASALGKLAETAAIPRLLELLRVIQDQVLRMELALSLARMVGEEYPFIQLMREMRADPGTAASQALSNIKKRGDLASTLQDELNPFITACAEAFARDEFTSAIPLLQEVIRRIQAMEQDPICSAILQECDQRLEELGAQRIEYVILGIYTLNSCLKKP